MAASPYQAGSVLDNRIRSILFRFAVALRLLVSA